MMTIRKQLTEAIEASGQTRHEIAQATGLHYRTVDQFLNANRDIRLSSVEALVEHFGMRLTFPRRNQAKG